jgi:hypothetical protein
MNKLYQYTILSKDIINLIGKYLLPSKNHYQLNKQDLYNELISRTSLIQLYLNFKSDKDCNRYIKRKKILWYIAVK